MACNCKETVERILRDMNEFLQSLDIKKKEDYDDIIDEYIVNEIFAQHSNFIRNEECSEDKICWHEDPEHESSLYSCFKESPGWVPLPRSHDFYLVCTTCHTKYNISTVTSTQRDDEGDDGTVIFFPFKKGHQPSFFISAYKIKKEIEGDLLWSTIFEEEGYGDDFIQNIYVI